MKPAGCDLGTTNDYYPVPVTTRATPLAVAEFAEFDDDNSQLLAQKYHHNSWKGTRNCSDNLLYHN